MVDVVVTVPVCDGEEDRLFGRFLGRFLESCEQDSQMSEADAPIVMVRSDPSLGGAVKVVTFQESQAADAFARGWSRIRQAWAST